MVALPMIERVEAGPVDETEALIRSTRARLAGLGLQLRALEAEAAELEATAAATPPSAVSQRLEEQLFDLVRMAEQRYEAEVAAARATAARRIRSAYLEAARLVDGALGGRAEPARPIIVHAPPTAVFQTRDPSLRDMAPGVASTRTGVRRFLYADVVVPMIAVAILLVVLLAWIG